ncbi:unnamed protein product [Prunus brigantina]
MKEVVQKKKRNPSKRLNGKEIESKDSYAIPDPNTLVSDSNMGTELSEINENFVIHYVDDVNRFEEVPQDLKANLMMSKGNIDDEDIHILVFCFLPVSELLKLGAKSQVYARTALVFVNDALGCVRTGGK